MTSLNLLQHEAYEHLKNSIISGELCADRIYSETKIAKALGLSRTPVRDALQRLSQNKLVNIIPNKGFMIHKMTIADVTETFQMRGAIEGYATTQIAREHDTLNAKETICKLQDILEAQKALLKHAPVDLNTFTTIDQQFHTAIVAYLDNENFNELFQNYMYRIHVFAIDSFKTPNRFEHTLSEHKMILDAIQKGDTSAVYEATLFHMEAPKKIIIENMLKEEAEASAIKPRLSKCQL